MNKIGKKCFVVNRESMYYGEWGSIMDFDGELYHVAIANDPNSVPVFSRNEIKIPYGQNKKGVSV